MAHYYNIWMQEPFEFNAPKFYPFLAENKRRDTADYSLDLTDPNDYWFMVTHVELSPQKEDDSDEEVTEVVPKREPIRRTHAERVGG